MEWHADRGNRDGNIINSDILCSEGYKSEVYLYDININSIPERMYKSIWEEKAERKQFSLTTYFAHIVATNLVWIDSFRVLGAISVAGDALDVLTVDDARMAETCAAAASQSHQLICKREINLFSLIN